MVDVLNEVSPVAHVAPLKEALFERTDLRVKYPDLKRERGARINVTLAFTAEDDSKAYAGPLAAEYVWLSPLHLARHAAEPANLGPFTDFPWGDFRDSLGGPCSDERILAKALHDLFTSAVNSAMTHPLGPLTRLPAPVRQFVRMYVVHYAATSTASMRERVGN